jgi:putative heme-binding domain-containing protein
MLADGRVVTGIVREKTQHTVTVESQDGRATIDLSDVEESQPSELSLMPEGILQGLSESDARDLFAYLMSE